uniref:Uncharacterized protein n=1 Tax=viral metagenome TaxID=1070528 RepID=A0A6M3IG31_9ZZZZ
MTNIADEQKALEWVDADIEASEGMGDGDITQGGRKVYPLEILRTLRSALEPREVTMEDANNLFSFLYDVYEVDGDVRTAFVLWLRERGIVVKEGK